MFFNRPDIIKVPLSLGDIYTPMKYMFPGPTPLSISTCTCGHIGATWRIWLNLCFLRPTQVHKPNSKSIGSVTFAQLMAECRRVHWRHVANTIVHVHNGTTLRIQMNVCFFRPTQLHNPNGKSISSAVSAQLTTKSHYILQWATLSPKTAPSRGGSGPPIYFMIPWASLSSQSKQYHDRFSCCLYRWPQSVPILYNVMPLSLLKIAPSHGGSGPHGFWAYPSPQPKRHLDRCSRFCRAH